MHDDIRPSLPSQPHKPKDHPAREVPKETSTSSFLTPDQVAAHDSGELPKLELDELPPAPKPRRALTKHRLWPKSRKQWLISSIVALVLIAGGVAGALVATSKPHQAAYVAVKPPIIVKSVSKPVTVASALTGLPVAPAVNNLPVTAVMVENTPQARPQSGLSQAGIIFEALTEGGITRFMALYQDQQPTMVGPVRSARPYFIQWALGYDAAYAHIGGSQAALADLPAWNVRDINGLTDPAPFHRISTRAAPHNDYTSIPSLISNEASRGWTSSNFIGFSRKADAPLKTPTASIISFNPSYFDYESQFVYNPSTNSYNRSEAGAAQTDANNNKQLSPKVVVGLIVPYSLGSMDTTNAYYSNYQVVGSGQAYIFQDGGVTIGQWVKTSPTQPLLFETAAGQPLAINSGQTWITALKSAAELNYK